VAARKRKAKAPDSKKVVDRPEWELMKLRREAEPFVVEGCVALRTISYYGVSDPIPDGECAIRALAIGKGDNIVGVTSGRRCHVFFFGFHPDRQRGVDLGVLPGAQEVGKSLIALANGTITGSFSPGINLFFHESTRDSSYFCSYGAGDVKTKKLRLRDDQIRAMTASRDGKYLYGITAPRGLVFRHDIAAGTTRVIAETGFERISDVMVTTRSGEIVGGMANGALFRLNPSDGAIAPVAEPIPCDKGRDFQNVLTAAALDDQDNLYGGGSDGYVFRYSPADDRMVSLGRPTKHQVIRCVTWGRDRRLYGVSGETDQVSHLFRYDPAIGEMKDLGILKIAFPYEWTATVFDCMAAGPNGEIYLGEADTRSHLFIYYPPCG